MKALGEKGRAEVGVNITVQLWNFLVILGACPNAIA